MEKRTYYFTFLLTFFFQIFTFNLAFTQTICSDCPMFFGEHVNYQGLMTSQVEVTTNGPNDLSENPLMSVCIDIQHGWLSDLFIILNSPGGKSYFLLADENNNQGGCEQPGANNMNVCFEIGNNFPISNNDPYAFNCNGPWNTNCFVGSWNISCGSPFSDLFPNATAAPNCDLFDFNVPGDPVEGTWTLILGCVCMQQAVEFNAILHNWSLNFDNGYTTGGSNSACPVVRGEMTAYDMPLIICQAASNTKIQSNISHNLPLSNYDAIRSALFFEDEIVDIKNTTFYAENYPAGLYQIKSMNVKSATWNGSFIPNLIGKTLEEASTFLEDNEVCFKWADGWQSVLFEPAYPTMQMDAVGCPGDCAIIGGNEYCEPGIYELIIPASSNRLCDTTYIVAFSYFYDEATIDATASKIPCINDTLFLTATGGLSYEWEGPNGFSSTEANPIVSNFNTNLIGDYTVYMTTEGECETSRVVSIDAYCEQLNWTIEVEAFDTLCFDTEPYALSFCDSMDNGVVALSVVDSCLIITGIAEGMDTICVVDTSNAVSIYYTIFVDVPEPEFTWPGDLNFDNIVNHFDVLYLGQAYQTTGFARNNATTNWEPQYALNWEQSTTNTQIDFKHIDANGDGNISADDLDVITQNWQLSHTDGINAELPTYQGTNTALLHLELPPLVSGQPYSAPLQLGTTNAPANEIYGLAFSLQIDPTLLADGELQLAFIDNFMGIAEEDWLSFYHYENGQLSASITRLDGQAISGFGEIAVLSFTVAENFPVGQPVIFDLANELCLTENETACGVIAERQYAEITTSLSVTPIPTTWLLAPNPTSEAFQLATDGRVPDQLQLIDMRQQLHRSWQPNHHSMTVSTEDLASGVYLLMIQIGTERYMERIVILK